MRNQDVRSYAKEKGVLLWKIAEYLNVTDVTLSKKLRKPFTDAEKEMYLKIIDQLAEAESEV